MVINTPWMAALQRRILLSAPTTPFNINKGLPHLLATPTTSSTCVQSSSSCRPFIPLFPSILVPVSVDRGLVSRRGCLCLSMHLPAFLIVLYGASEEILCVAMYIPLYFFCSPSCFICSSLYISLNAFLARNRYVFKVPSLG